MIFFCVGYNAVGHHKCENICKCCMRLYCEKTNPHICSSCDRETRNNICEVIHTKRVCDKLESCKLCGHKNGNRTHVCGDQDK